MCGFLFVGFLFVFFLRETLLSTQDSTERIFAFRSCASHFCVSVLYSTKFLGRASLGPFECSDFYKESELQKGSWQEVLY